MSGSLLTLMIIGAMLVGAGLAVWFCARRWWHYAMIAALTALLIRPTARNLTGDISPYLPEAIFEHGKDDFIWISIVATVFVPLVAASVLTFLVDRIWLGVRRGRVKVFDE
jgi:hypothetical protein